MDKQNKKNIELDVSRQAAMTNCSIINIENLVSNQVDDNSNNAEKELEKLSNKKK